MPYLLSLPAGVWLTVLFLLPMGTMALVSTQSGIPPGPFQQTFHFGNYGDVLSLYHVQLVRSLVYALIVTLVALVICYPMAYWIAFRGGAVRGRVRRLVAAQGASRVANFVNRFTST